MGGRGSSSGKADLRLMALLGGEKQNALNLLQQIKYD